MKSQECEFNKFAEQICIYSNLMWERGFAEANGGNLSVRLGNGNFLVTPTNHSKKGLIPDDLVLSDNRGVQINSLNGRMSSEFNTHLAIYKINPEAVAVIHAHPPYTCSFACSATFPTDPLTAEAVFWAENIKVIPYILPGSEELAEFIVTTGSGADVFVLKNHGIVTFGKSLKEAWFKCEVVEAQLKLYHLAASRGEEPLKLDNIQISKLREIKKVFFNEK